MANAWTRTYSCGHRARITKTFRATYSLEIFAKTGRPVLRFALLLPSLEVAQRTADAVVTAQNEPWVPALGGTFEADVAELHEMNQLSS